MTETITVKLKRGLLLDDKPQTEAVLREATVGDRRAARELYTDDELVGAEIVMSQVVRIGKIEGPIARDLFDKLPLHDFERLLKAVEELDERGRKDAEG